MRQCTVSAGVEADRNHYEELDDVTTVISEVAAGGSP